MTDEAFERLLRSVGREYNRPPSAPRFDALWERIEPDVRAAMHAPRSVVRRQWHWASHVAFGGALAATLVVGIAIGKHLRPNPPVVAAIAPVPHPPDVPPRAYDAATTRDLQRAQVLLVSYEKQARAGRIDPGIIAWANELHGTVEILHDSRATQDPEFKSFLQSLDLVLVQIATLDPDRQATDNEFVQQALTETNLMERLQSTLPADAEAGRL